GENTDSGARLKVTTKAPLVFRKVRRLMGLMQFMPSPLSVAFNRPHHARMRVAPAKDAGQRLLNIGIGCLGIPVQEGLRRHDHAAQAKATLHGLFIDEGFLNWVRLRTRSQSLEGRDLRSGDTRNRSDAGPDRLTFNNDGTATALAETAAKLRAAERQIVAEYV